MGDWNVGGIPAALVRAHCAGAVRAGLDLGRLLGNADIDADVADAAAEITSIQHLCLMLSNIVALGDEMHGLAKKPVKTGFAELALRSAITSSSLADAVAAFVRFYRVTTDALRLETSQSEAGLEIRLLADGATQEQSAALEEIYSVWLVMVLSWLVQRRLKVTRFTVRNPLHPDIGGHHWGHGGPTHFGACTSLLLGEWKLAIPRVVVRTDNILWTAMEHWRATDPRSAPAPDWANATFRAADAALPDNVSVRTLRRRLATHGNNFRNLRGQAIARDAVQWLQATDAKVDDIAERLGYADARSFRRLLKNVTGMSPSEIRSHGRFSVPVSAPPLLRRIEGLTRQLLT